LSQERALEQMETMEEQGAVHTIWTMMTPFIGAVCNCLPQKCLALKTLTRVQLETLERAEHVARVDKTLCNGCGLCDVSCPFKAIDRVTESNRSFASIDQYKCFGCGICRRVCNYGAILLVLR